jgi:hypothetical protein
MELSGKIKDSTSELLSLLVPIESGLSLSGSGHVPIPHATETDPVFTAWDKKTGISIAHSQITDYGTAIIAPTGLMCSAAGVSLGYGKMQLGYATLTWDVISSTSFDHYQVRYKIRTLSYYNYINCNTNTITISGLLPDIGYDFGVTSINRYGTISTYSSDIVKTITADATLPATVSGVSATPGIQMVILAWTLNSELDIHSYNIYRNTTNTSGTSVLIANTSSNYFIDGGRTGGTVYYYWIKGKDNYGNLSTAYSTVVYATPTNVGTGDITIGAITPPLINPAIVAINPVDGTINANTVGTLQLQTDAVQEANILEDSITAAKLSIAAINPITGEINANKVGTIQIDAGAVTEAKILNAAITANKIATGAILEGHIAVGAITTNKIAAGAITANEIAAGAITAQLIKSYNFVVTEGTFTDHDPTATEFSWSDIVILYDGLEYNITNGHCPATDKHVYWEYPNTTFYTSPSLPALTNDGFLVAYNEAGNHLLVWNSTVVNGNRITTGSITATNMAANSITANAIEAGAITALKIAAGAITARKLTTYNFMVVGTLTTLTGSIDPIASTTVTGVGTLFTTELVVGDEIFVTGEFRSVVSITSNTLLTVDTAFSDNANDTSPAKIDLTVEPFINYGAGPAYIGWRECAVRYNGITYPISAGNCANTDVYIYWVFGGSTFSASVTLPELGNFDFMVATNGNTAIAKGTAVYLWNSTTIDGNRITTGSIAATQIAAGAITANKIAALAVEASHIAAGAITAVKIAAGSITVDKLAAGAITASDIDATTGTIGAWNIDSNSIYSGTKVTGDGYAASIGDMTIRSDGSIHAKNFYVDADGDVSFIAGSTSSINGIRSGIIDIGTWDMDVDANVSIALPSFNQVRSVDVIIKTDNALWVYALNTYAGGSVAGWWIINVASGNIDLYRTAGGLFDQSSFSTTPSGGRGYIIVQYEI